jgi:8-oxo-dGTP diphosphatase
MKRDYPDQPIVGVGAVIIKDGRAIVIRRMASPMAGEWSIPGGALEIGETLRQGTEREALEETGLVVTAGGVLDVFDAIYNDPDGSIQYHFVLVDSLCKPVSGELRAGGDAAEVRWITESDLDALPVADSIAGVIRKGLRGKSH